MNMKRVLKAAEVAIGTGLYLLDQKQHSKNYIRKRVANQVDDLRDRAQDLRDRAKDVYDAATDRLGRVSDALHDDGSSSFLSNSLRFAAGVGIGIGIAILFAPASGEEMRNRLSSKAQEFGDSVRQRYGSQGLPATGD